MSKINRSEMNIKDFSFNKKRVDCPICFGPVEDSFTSVDGFLKIGGFTYSFCPSCDYYWINPQPKHESINSFYNSHGTPITEDILQESFRAYQQKGKPYQVTDYFSRLLPDLPSGSRFLDFGCGGGLLLYHNKAYYEVYGVEISDLALRHCEKLGIRMGKTLEAFKNVKFDLISAIDVIEHVTNPKAFLNSFKEVLKPGGVIFLRLPVIDGLTFNRKCPDKWKWVYSPYHLSMFSIKAVRRLSNVCGLECEVIYDEIMHTTWDLFWFRWQESFFMKNPLTRKICHLLFPLIRKMLILLKYSSDTVFVMLWNER